MPQITLPPPESLSMPLEDTLLKRASERQFARGAEIALTDMSTIFGHAIAVRPKGGRAYPSGGGLFPIETYLVARTVENLPLGIYHYSPDQHGLEQLWDIPHETHIFDGTPSAEWAEYASAIVILTSVWERSYNKYGDFAYQLALIEAGHIAQNIALVSASLELVSCPLSGFNDAEVEHLLDIDGEGEQIVYTMMLGKKQHEDV